MLQVGLQKKWRISSFDIATAFLRGDGLRGAVYSEPPPGIEKFLKVPDGCCLRLRRPVYGLADWPRQWHATLWKTLARIGFVRSWIDPSLFLFYRDLRPNEKRDKQKEFEQLLASKRKSWLGDLGHTLLEHLEDGRFKDKVMIGYLGCHVDDALVHGDPSFYSGPLWEVQKAFNIPELSTPPMKFLGGVLSQPSTKDGRQDPTKLVLDYTHHWEKLKETELGKDVDDETLLDGRLHQAFRSNLGIASYLVHHGYPAACFEISLLWSVWN